MQETLVQLGRVVGQLEGLQSRLSSQDQQISQVRNDVTQRFSEHESRENPILKAFEVRLAKIERLIYIAIGSVIVLAAVVKFGLDAITITMR
jgi:hypothetical protein